MEKRSTPQERWAANTPQRRLVESIFEGSVWEELVTDDLQSAEAGETTELDALLRAMTGFYHMVKVHTRMDHEDLAHIDQLLLALADPVTQGRGQLVGMPALRRMSGLDVESISDTLNEISALVRLNCSSPPAGANPSELTLSLVTDCLHQEIAEMSAVVEYRPSQRLHVLAGNIAALYCDGAASERVHLLQQHLSLDTQAPLHMVDSLPLRAALYGFGRHHDNWAGQREGGLDTPEAQLVHVLTGRHGYRAESMRETLACMSPDQIDEIEQTIIRYLAEFTHEYGAGAELPEEELDWSLLPELLSRLVDAGDNLGTWVRGVAGHERPTRDLLEQLREWHARAPARYFSEAAAELLDAVLDDGEIDPDRFEEAIESLVTLFTTPVAVVQASPEPTVRTVVVNTFLTRLRDVEAGRAEPDGEVVEVEAVVVDALDADETDEDEDDEEDGDELEEELEPAEDPVEVERQRLAALAVADVEPAADADEVGDKGDPDEDDLAELEEVEPDLDGELDDDVVSSSPRRTSYVDATPWASRSSSSWRPGATVPSYDRPAADRASVYTSTGTPAIARTHVPSRFDQERIAQITGRTLETKPAERPTYDWDTLPEDITGLTTVEVFEALLANVDVSADVSRITSHYIRGGELPSDLLMRDSVRRGFEAVRRQFEAFTRTLHEQDRSTVVHIGGTTTLKYLLNGQLSDHSRISAELDQLARHVLVHSRTPKPV